MKKAITLPAQPDLLRWTDCGILATDTDCLSKYSLNSVFVFKRLSHVWRQMAGEDTLSAVLNGCFSEVLKVFAVLLAARERRA